MVQNAIYWQSGNLGFISALLLTCFVSLSVSIHLAELGFFVYKMGKCVLNSYQEIEYIK